MELEANASRFSGFADLYDAVRPSPPDELAPLLARYARGTVGTVVDLGSGSGLSSRWAATWAGEVVGVEPSDDMRDVAARQAPPNARFVPGWAHDTGLDAGGADVVVAVQAMHWMEPVATLTEVARLLRPGGVFAAIDCDWPPSVGSAAAERAWADCRRAIRVHETRAAGATDAALASYSARDAHRDRALAGGVRSWSKDGHLANLEASGHFAWCHEVVLHRVEEGTAERFVELLRSQGDYQALRRAGLDDDELGVTAFERAARAALGDGPRRFLFGYRARIGVVAGTG